MVCTNQHCSNWIWTDKVQMGFHCRKCGALAKAAGKGKDNARTMPHLPKNLTQKRIAGTTTRPATLADLEEVQISERSIRTSWSDMVIDPS